MFTAIMKLLKQDATEWPPAISCLIGAAEGRDFPPDKAGQGSAPWKTHAASGGMNLGKPGCRARSTGRRRDPASIFVGMAGGADGRFDPDAGRPGPRSGPRPPPARKLQPCGPGSRRRVVNLDPAAQPTAGAAVRKWLHRGLAPSSARRQS